MQTSFLDITHIEQSNTETEWHPLKPFLPSNGKVLFLGSFPPQRKRWCMNFYYPNFINDHWRIEGEVFYTDKSYFIKGKSFDIEKIIIHCNRVGIGFHDTASAVRRLKDNASDKFLEILVPTDIPKLIAEMPQLKAIVVTGEKAAQTICQHLFIREVPKVNSFVTIPESSSFPAHLELYRLPSSSRAYPLAFDKKVEAYRAMFERYGIIQ